MKLVSQLQPRRDGTVIVRDSAGQAHVFSADADGALCCEISDPDLLASLLRTGNFIPADDADFEAATRLAMGDPSGEADDAGGLGSDDDDVDDDEVVNGGLPLEANTPAAPAPVGRRARQRKAG